MQICGRKIEDLFPKTMKTTYGLPLLREKTLDALKTAFVNNHLEEKEYESRVKQALEAQYVEDLRATLYDFPKEIKESIFSENVPAKKSTESEIPAFVPNPDTRDVYKTILSEKKSEILRIEGNSVRFTSLLAEQDVDLRKCDFNGERLRFDISCVLGSTIIDLRNENLEGKHIDIYIDATFGSVKIFIPSGGYVNNALNTYLGDFSMRNKGKSWLNKVLGKNEETPKETRFTLSVYGTCTLSEVVIVF